MPKSFIQAGNRGADRGLSDAFALRRTTSSAYSSDQLKCLTNIERPLSMADAGTDPIHHPPRRRVRDFPFLGERRQWWPLRRRDHDANGIEPDRQRDRRLTEDRPLPWEDVVSAAGAGEALLRSMAIVATDATAGWARRAWVPKPEQVVQAVVVRFEPPEEIVRLRHASGMDTLVG